MKNEVAYKQPMQVFAVRHCEDSGDQLTDWGRHQAANLADKISLQVPSGCSVAVMSSPLSRARETAEIIAHAFSMRISILPLLSEGEYAYGEQQMNEIVKSARGAEVAIVVTHAEAPSGIIHAFSRAQGGPPVMKRVVDRGNGLAINIETGEVRENLLAAKVVIAR